MALPTSLLNQAPRWFKPLNQHRKSLSLNQASWLFETGSLTQRLRTKYGEGFAVKVILQRWHKPFVDERRLLQLAPQEFTLIREVILMADQQVLILARSIIPYATIATANRHLSHLGSRPLGEVLFAYRDLGRLAFELTTVTPSHWQNQLRENLKLEQNIWGRRTVYAIHSAPLLVSEFFTPGLLETN